MTTLLWIALVGLAGFTGWTLRGVLREKGDLYFDNDNDPKGRWRR